MLRNVDLEQFWADNDEAMRDPFSPGIPQFPMGIAMGYETFFSELGHPFNLHRLEEDYEFARAAARAYNDKAERIVGRQRLDEIAFDPSRGLIIDTAGSINDGSLLSSMQTVMWTIQSYGRLRPAEHGMTQRQP